LVRQPDPAELAADLSPDPARPIRLETISTSPRVRLLHNFVSASEAAELIRIAEPMYHRSGTARANGDTARTSFSASLPSSDRVVQAVRQRIARFSGYPEANLEPLQTVGLEEWIGSCASPKLAP
jgi:prolyl 4-hydroxylase